MSTFRKVSSRIRTRLGPWLLEDRSTGQDGGGPRRTARALSMSGNSLSIMVNVFSTGLLGYAFWILAARMLPAETVGTASGIISAVMLCAQVALLGAGAAVVVLLGGEKGHEERFLSGAISLMVLTGAAVGGLFLILAAGLFEGLSRVGRSPWYAVIFAVMVVSWTVTLLVQHTFIALRRSDQTVLRNSLVGVLRIVGIAAIVPIAATGSDLMVLLLIWMASTVGGLVLSVRQLRQAYGRFRYRWHIDWSIAWSILRVGLPNHIVTFAMLAPGLVLPIVVTELLSPEMNAYWYALWMIAGGVFIASSSSGQSLFAELADRPESLQRDIGKAVRFSLVLGIPLAIALIALAGLVLPILGNRYAEEGTTPLRIITLGIVPLTFFEVYVSVCRVTHRLKEAMVVCTLNALASITGGTAGAVWDSLTGISLAWLAVQMLTGLWSLVRLLRFSQARAEDDAGVVSIHEPDRHRWWNVARGDRVAR